MAPTMVEATENPVAASQGARRARIRHALGRLLAQLRWSPAGLRTRIVAWFIFLLALATLSFVLVTRQVILIRLDERLDADLQQEVAELRSLATSVDPQTGLPFGPNVERIFRVYLERNVPSRNEALITFVDGRPFLRSPQIVPYRLDNDP